MTPSLATVIERVRKLRALSTSDNPHEAARATAIADRLIQEHRLEEAVLEAAPELRGSKEPLVSWKHRAVHWQRVLGGVVAAHYDVAMLELTGDGVSLMLVGTRDDIALTRELFQWVKSEIERLSHVPGQRRLRYAGSELTGFRLGCVDAVFDALERMKREVLAGHRGALVLASRREQAIALIRSMPGTKVLPVARTVPADAYDHGRQLGAGIDVSESRRRRLDTGIESEARCLPK